jgi:putative ATP-dependent endonuclease of OLD family
MSDLDISFKIKNYKCFRDEFVGFDKIKPVNIIIGRNNSGKSSMLDILQFLTDKNSLTKGRKDNINMVLQIEDAILEKELKTKFQEEINHGDLFGNHWRDNGLHLIGLRVKYHIPGNGSHHEFINPELFDAHPPTGYPMHKMQHIFGTRKKYADEIVINFVNGTRLPEFFNNKIVRRLHSERDIKNEVYTEERKDFRLQLHPDGSGATNIICNFLNNAKLNRDTIQKELLSSLNQIFYPDCFFEEITVRSSGNSWEVYLLEKEKGLVPLSKSGSGLKTVILALLNLLIVPKIQDSKEEMSDYLFAFEELENNLHPSLLRRLFSYIEDFAIKNKCHFFITTHSNVIVDQFSQSPNAQIIHVVNDGSKACATTINSFQEHSAVLDDLGVKASDLLQSNGIIWLEGPSDRTYFNKWIELYSGGLLKEHRDYECAFYGGSLLAHFESEDPLIADVDAVNILRVNRNAILIGDSDKTESDKPLKPRLEKMKTAMENMGAYIWITDAKEIENYIPATVLNKVFKRDNLPDIKQYEIFYHEKENDYWHKNELTGSFDKIELAHKVIPHLTREDLDKGFELKDKISKICEKIKKWNEDLPTIR